MKDTSHIPAQISLRQWEGRYRSLREAGLREASYGGPLQRHFAAGDYRLEQLRFDNSAAALRLWNFLLSETERLFAAKRAGKKIIATMKDLGTVPILAYALPETVAFYPDGTWWIPCVMRQSTRDLAIADAMGIDETFCPVRAMLGAFETNQHFPPPDLLVCSVGATCDDFSAIAQRLESRRHAIHWWEIPSRQGAREEEDVMFVTSELRRIAEKLAEVTGYELTNERLREAIAQANKVREKLNQLRQLVFTAPKAPLPALEMLIAEMLAIHYCSDRGETLAVLAELVDEVQVRIEMGEGCLPADAVRVFWVNPVADLRVMNLLEECGGRLCGSDFMFCHALDAIPTDVLPMEALARMALADPMVGPAGERARRIVRDAKLFGAQAVIVSRIPGASHCATEGTVIREVVSREAGLSVLEIEVPPVSDGVRAGLRTRLEALMETVRRKRA
ncbi:MAG: 2-hydroxyacyl-CoA dehydratase family protein [Phycisphaerales bacterium]|nr:2-hydroxyacyl-CoA dehydratase family protein [Phycisphaerales bacterium]